MCANESECCRSDDSEEKVELLMALLYLPSRGFLITVYSLCLLLCIFGWKQKVVHIQHAPQCLFFLGSPTRSSNRLRGTNLFCFHSSLCLAKACSPWNHPLAWARVGDICLSSPLPTPTPPQWTRWCTGSRQLSSWLKRHIDLPHQGKTHPCGLLSIKSSKDRCVWSPLYSRLTWQIENTVN